MMLKTSAKAGAAVVAGILATAVGGALVMTTGFLLEDAAEEAATTPDEGTGVQETAAEAEEVPVENSQSALTDFANWMEESRRSREYRRQDSITKCSWCLNG